jgi:RNA polymerase sigma factor (TIGR02999 family)
MFVMSFRDENDVSLLLTALKHGDLAAENRLLSVVYSDLRKIARRYSRNEPAGNTLTTTALVHEAYLRLMPRSNDFTDRTHFFAVASRVMRNILVDYARNRLSEKRGGGKPLLNIDDLPIMINDSPQMLLDIHDALLRLRAFSPRQERIVEYLFFGGMTEAEVASHMELSSRTVRREWSLARAWLYREMKGKEQS